MRLPHISDKEITELVSSSQQSDLLEHIIEQRSKELSGIISYNLDYGPELADDEIDREFAFVKQATDSFLGIGYPDTPNWSCYNIDPASPEIQHSIREKISAGFMGAARGANFVMGAAIVAATMPAAAPLALAMGGFGLYVSARGINQARRAADTVREEKVYIDAAGEFYPDRLLAVVARDSRCIMINSASHEYAHYLQWMSEGRDWGDGAFLEGHAYGTSKYVSEIYAKQEGNYAHLVDPLQIALGFLKSCYVWNSSLNSRQPSWALLDSIPDYHVDQKSNLGYSEPVTPTADALGTAYFDILEQSRGVAVYKDILTGSL